MKPALELAACFAFITLTLSACAGKKRAFADGVYEPDLAGPESAGSGGTAATGSGREERDAPADDTLGFSPPEAAALAAACARDVECASGFCADGVCCNRRCADLCATCRAPERVGTCEPAPTDPACDALTCAGATECRGYDQAQLQQNCEGLGQCRLDVECAPVDRPAGTPCQSGAGACDGAGECVVAGKLVLGAACIQNEDCGEGHCVPRSDGTSVCCDSSCDGICQQCSVAGRCNEAPAAEARCPAVACPANGVCRQYASPAAACRSAGACATPADCPFTELRPASECDCGPDGACQLLLGAACTLDAECATGVCSAGVCCAQACDECEQCDPVMGQCVSDETCECRAGELSTCALVHGALGDCAERTVTCTADNQWPGPEACAATGPEICDAVSRDEDCDGVANERPPCEAYAQIDAGRFHACAVSTAGNALCWGFNEAQQVGDGLTAPRLSPFTIPELTGVSKVVAGDSLTCALLADGSVSCWGSNSNGALGDGTTVDRSSPVRVASLPPASSIDSGGSTTCAVLVAGGVSCWGALVGSPLPEDVPGFDGITQLASGSDHVCGIVGSDGSVRCFGGNQLGQLGNGTTSTNLTPPAAVPGLAGVRALAASFFHTCAVLGTGQVSCWGLNSAGQLGDGTTIDRLNPTTVPGITDAVAAGVGDNHTCVVLADGAIRCWGVDDGGQLGRGERANSLVPVEVVGLGGAAVSVVAGQNHSCAAMTDGSARCWGNILGDGTGFTSAIPTRVLGP